MDLEEGLQQIKRGNALLFTGAGFSFGAENALPTDSEIPSAAQFATQLANSLAIVGNYQLPAISQYYIKKRGEHDLVRVMVETFTIAKVKRYHIDIAKNPWRRVYTTNYDNCFETAAKKSLIDWTPITIDSPISAAKHRCVHINGHISNITIETLQKQVKLSHSSYSSESFSSSRWSQQLRQDMNSSKAVFFIGYSLSDIDISRILFENPEIRDRTFFIVSDRSDPVSESLLEAYGHVCAIGAEEFANRLNSTAPSEESGEHQFSWLQPYRSADQIVPPDDVAAFDLILKGIISQGMIGWSLGENKSIYTVRRTMIDDLISEIAKGNRWIVVHSDLGNGKTIIKEQLSFILNNSGYDVYWDSDVENYKIEDIKQLSKQKNKSIVIIDSDKDRIETIDRIRSFEFDDCSFIIMLRTTLFQLGERRYEDHLPDNFLEFDANKLTDSEVERFVELFDTLGLWGLLANLKSHEKDNKIKVEFDRSIQRLIISVFEQSEIGRKLISEAKNIIDSSPTVCDVLLLCFILTRLEITASPTIMSELIPNVDAWKTIRSTEFKKAAEFIRFEHGHIRSRSSILSNVILRSAVRPEVLISCVERVVRHLAGKTRNTTLHHVFTQLTRFPVIEGMIEHPRKREIIIGYFQSIKELSYSKSSPDFWLHYAMARLTFGEYPIAETYFNTALKLAQGNIKKTSDVKNHFARLLLDSRIKSDDYNDHFVAFEKAHSILIGQMNQDNNRHYPYRQAKKYVEFISSRKAKMSDSEIQRFVAACNQIRSSIQNSAKKISYSSEISECDLDMERAIQIARGTPVKGISR